MTERALAPVGKGSKPPLLGSALLKIIAPACRRHLRDGASSGDIRALNKNIAAEIQGQIRLSKQVAERSGRTRVHADDFAVADLVNEVAAALDVDPHDGQALGVIFGCIDMLEGGEIADEASPAAPTIDIALLSQSARLFKIFRLLPMGSTVDDACSFMLSSALTTSKQFSEKEGMTDVIHASDILPFVVDVIVDTWVDMAAITINPSAMPITNKDIEQQLLIDLLPMLEEYPMGHKGNESSFIHALAAEINQKCQLLTAGFRVAFGEHVAESVKAGYATLFLCPLARSAWKRIAARRTDGVETMTDHEVSEWLDSASKPLSLADVMTEITDLIDTRTPPTESVYLDLFAVEQEVERRFLTVWGAYKGLKKVLSNEA